MKNIKLLSVTMVFFACAGCAKQPYYSNKIITQLDTMAEKAEKKFPGCTIRQALLNLIASDSQESAENTRVKASALCRDLITQTLEPKRRNLLLANARALLMITQNCNNNIIEAWQDQNNDLNKRPPILDTPEAVATLAGHFVYHLTTCDLINLDKQIAAVCNIKIFVDNLYWYKSEIGDTV